MSSKLMLIDGHSLMYRAFHALPLLDIADGVYTNAVYGFLGMFFSALQQEQPSHIAVAFDLHGPTFRHERFPDYKANRSPTPPELRGQLDLIKRILEAMHIRICTSEGYEGDDILGTLSKQASAHGMDSVLITGDRDSYQLADAHTTIIYTKRGISDTLRITPEYIMEQYGIRPLQLVDVKALMGDKSDNIPGVPGVGEKTAVKLIAQYGDLETVLERAPAEQKGALRERLINNVDQARMSLELSRINRDAPVDWDEQSLKLGRIIDARPLFEEYRLKSLLARLDQFGLTEAPADPPPEPAAKEVPPEELHGAEALAAWARAKVKHTLAIYIGDHISVAADNCEGARLMIGGDLISPGVSEDDALEALRPEIESTQITKIFCGLKPVIKRLYRLGIALKGTVHDVQLAAYVLDSQLKSFKLESLIECPEYGCGAQKMVRLNQLQLERLQRDGLMSVYNDVELPLAYVLAGMERRGFLIDADELRRLGSIYDARIDELTRSIRSLGGSDININSPKQISELLFGTLGLTGGKKTKSGYSTDAESLEALQDGHPIIPQILEYRKYAKLKSTYIDALLRQRTGDGRIHTSFDQLSTATGRISSLEPNLQNIPVRTELGREIRGAFIAPPGKTLVDCDYSQIELRVLAEMSGDEVMRDAFQKGQDIHQRTAAEVYQVPLSSVTREMRSAAKAVNFGIVYGISDFGLAKNIGVSRQEARSFIDRYFERYKFIKKYMDEQVSQGKLNGYVTTMMGRRRYLSELSSPNYNTRQFGERAAMNSPIQGTAADIIKLAMVRVDEALKCAGLEARLILQVHDELIIEAPDGEVEQTMQLLKHEMETVVNLSVPLTADVSRGRNWNECK